MTGRMMKESTRIAVSVEQISLDSRRIARGPVQVAESSGSGGYSHVEGNRQWFLRGDVLKAAVNINRSGEQHECERNYGNVAVPDFQA